MQVSKLLTVFLFLRPIETANMIVRVIPRAKNKIPPIIGLLKSRPKNLFLSSFSVME